MRAMSSDAVSEGRNPVFFRSHENHDGIDWFCATTEKNRAFLSPKSWLVFSCCSGKRGLYGLEVDWYSDFFTEYCKQDLHLLVRKSGFDGQPADCSERKTYFGLGMDENPIKWITELLKGNCPKVKVVDLSKCRRRSESLEERRAREVFIFRKHSSWNKGESNNGSSKAGALRSRTRPWGTYQLPLNDEDFLAQGNPGWQP